jgi:hypothetical protein
MRKLFLTLVLVTTAGCGGGGSNGSGVKSDSFSPEPTGALKLETDSGNTDMTFGNNCQTDHLDAKIKPGTTQGVLSNIFAQDTGALTINGSYTVKSVDQSHQTFVTETSYTNSTEQKTCHLTSEGTLCDGESATPSHTQASGDQSCELQNASGQAFENAHGTLQLKADGKIIPIKQSKMTSKGNLFCGGKDTGKMATLKATFITSTEIPALASARGFGCNGLAFMYMQLTDAAGIVRNTQKMEIVSQSIP